MNCLTKMHGYQHWIGFILLVSSSLAYCGYQIPPPKQYHHIISRRAVNDTSSEQSTSCDSTCVLIVTAGVLIIFLGCLAGSIYYATCKPNVEKYHDNWVGKKLARKRPLYGTQVSLRQLDNNISQLGNVTSATKFDWTEDSGHYYEDYEPYDSNGVFYNPGSVQPQNLQYHIPVAYPGIVTSDTRPQQKRRLFSLAESFDEPSGHAIGIPIDRLDYPIPTYPMSASDNRKVFFQENDEFYANENLNLRRENESNYMSNTKNVVNKTYDNNNYHSNDAIDHTQDIIQDDNIMVNHSNESQLKANENDFLPTPDSNQLQADEINFEPVSDIENEDQIEIDANEKVDDSYISYYKDIPKESVEELTEQNSSNNNTRRHFMREKPTIENNELHDVETEQLAVDFIEEDEFDDKFYKAKVLLTPAYEQKLNQEFLENLV